MLRLLISGALPITEQHLAVLKKALPNAEILSLTQDPTPAQLADADFILGNPAPVLLIHCKHLRLLQLYSAGAEAYPRTVLPKGARLANASGAYGLSISEHMLAMLLSLMRRFPAYQRNQQEQRWQYEGGVQSIFGSTVLVVGLGDIGGEFAKRVAAMGATVLGVRRTGTDRPDYLDELYTVEHLDTLLPRADVVALSLPSTPATAGLLSRERIELMKKGAYLLNVGRGSAVDQTALCHALQTGHLAGAGLDVTEPEPLPPQHPLWSAPNLLLTPHVAGGFSLPATVDRIVAQAARNFAACLQEEALCSEVDFQTGYRKLSYPQ